MVSESAKFRRVPTPNIGPKPSVINFIYWTPLGISDRGSRDGDPERHDGGFSSHAKGFESRIHGRRHRRDQTRSQDARQLRRHVALRTFRRAEDAILISAPTVYLMGKTDHRRPQQLLKLGTIGIVVWWDIYFADDNET